MRADLGQAYQASGQLDHAISEFTRALDLDPSYVAGYTLRGQCYEAQSKLADAGQAREGLLEQARVDYDYALDLHPQYSEVWLRRGMMSRGLGLNRRARQELFRFLQLAGADHPQVEEVSKILEEYRAAEPKRGPGGGRRSSVSTVRSNLAMDSNPTEVPGEVREVVRDELIHKLKVGDVVEVVIKGDSKARKYRFHSWAGQTLSLSPVVPGSDPPEYRGRVRFVLSQIVRIKSLTQSGRNR